VVRRAVAALSGLGSALLDLVFPPRCAACGEPPAGGSPFCALCAEAVDPVPDPCPRCGRPGAAGAGGCAACAEAPPGFSALAAAALFGGPVADAVHALKYGGRAAVAGPLGAWMATRLPPAPPSVAGPVVVTIPLGRRRRIERGYDQAALLGDALARSAGLRRLRGALRRVRETPPQVGLDRTARIRNVAGAFLARPSVRGLDVLLVDDVVTTGATADAAARALAEAGARSVRVAALARAD
jgi:ComF family protein